MKKENKHTEITRKEAIKKMGKYAAFTAVGTFAVLSPLRAQNTSTPLDPNARAEEQQTLDVAPVPSTSTSEGEVGKTQVKNNF